MSVYKADDPTLFAEALDSVLEQQFSEPVHSRIYLAIDGPVPDALLRVVSQRVKVIHCVLQLERNAGLANALNALIARLQDEVYVFRMDADDRCLPARYQAQLTRMHTDPAVDILGTDIIECDEATGGRRRIGFARSHRSAIANLCWRVPVAHPTVCFRREVFRRVPGYPLSGTNEDIALWFQCAKAGLRFGNVDQALLNFRIGPGFWQRRSVKKAFSELRCYVAGIWMLDGLTWKYVLPVLRFGLRVAPNRLSRWAYSLPMLRSR